MTTIEIAGRLVVWHDAKLVGRFRVLGDLYLLGCPTFFVDQLNMVLNFGGAAKVLTVVAPYTCPGCGVESGELIDVLSDRANLAKGGLPEKECARCGGKLEFDETPESYFAFVSKYAASSIQPAAAQLLAAHGLYASSETSTERPPRIIKLVHGAVTYFRIIGTIGSMFRARPFLVGAEGEVVIDLAEVDRFDTAGQKEWRRLIKSLAGQVPAVTLVDINEGFLAAAIDRFTKDRALMAVGGLFYGLSFGLAGLDADHGHRGPCAFDRVLRLLELGFFGALRGDEDGDFLSGKGHGSSSI